MRRRRRRRRRPFEKDSAVPSSGIVSRNYEPEQHEVMVGGGSLRIQQVSSPMHMVLRLSDHIMNAL